MTTWNISGVVDPVGEAALVTKIRARLNTTLAGLTDSQLNVLIGAASVLISRRYTIPDPIPSDVEEACVQFMAYMTQEFGMVTERLGDWSTSRFEGTSAWPSVITLLLYDYKTPTAGPRAVEVAL